MSRKNFIHQADLLFSNANGTELNTNKGIVFEEPSNPISKPNPILTENKEREIEIEAKLKADAEAKAKHDYELSKKRNYDQDVINSKPYSPVEPLRPSPSLPELPIMPKEPEKPLVSDGLPVPKPTVTVENNIGYTTVDSVDDGSVGLGISSDVSGDSKKEVLKKDYIPLLLTVVGVLVMVLKPIKK